MDRAQITERNQKKKKKKNDIGIYVAIIWLQAFAEHMASVCFSSGKPSDIGKSFYPCARDERGSAEGKWQLYVYVSFEDLPR